MREPGDRRTPGLDGQQPTWDASGTEMGRRPARLSPLIALAGASSVTLLAAAGWAIVRGIFELGPGSLVVAFLGGWGIGRWLRRADGSALLAGVMGLAAWLLGLVFTWLLALAILPRSTRTYLERIEGTPFLDWLAPQFDLLEVAGLVLWVAVAVYTTGSPRQARA